jgi:hypothetical protein
VDPGVAGGAKGNQEAALMNAGAAVVDRELTLSPATLTLPAIAVEDSVAMAGEAAAGVGPPLVAMPAEAGTQACLPAGTEKPGLPIPRGSAAGR